MRLLFAILFAAVLGFAITLGVIVKTKMTTSAAAKPAPCTTYSCLIASKSSGDHHT